MIQLIGQGLYVLTQTHGQTKILVLNGDKTYAWVNAEGIGEILVASHRTHDTDHILAIGKYRIYDVKGESKLTDLIHLEFLVGDGKWQGYLLPTGLPDGNKIRNRIIPTREIITHTTH